MTQLYNSTTYIRRGDEAAFRQACHQILQLLQRMDDVQSMATPDQAEPSEPTSLPEYAWQTAAAELCEIQGKTYLVLVD